MKKLFSKINPLILAVLFSSGCYSAPSTTADYPIIQNNNNIVSSMSESNNLLAKGNCAPELKVVFETDERLFTFLAWMNWVADAQEKEAQMSPEQLELRAYLKTLPAELYQKHRQAYEKYLNGQSLYVKNGLLISDSQFYGYPPEFATHIPRSNSDESQRFRALPSPLLLKEFYSAAKIEQIWKNKYQAIHQGLIDKYQDDARKVMADNLCLLKTAQPAPVSIRFNIIGDFGIGGQTDFSDRENKFIIKINPQRGDESYQNNLAVIRHEFTHSLLNETIAKHKHLIEPALKKVNDNLKLQATMSPEELMARSLEYMHYYPQEDRIIRENTEYYFKNLLFMHFVDSLPAFEKSGKSFKDFIPELFRTYNPDKEIERWKKIEIRIKLEQSQKS